MIRRLIDRLLRPPSAVVAYPYRVVISAGDPLRVHCIRACTSMPEARVVMRLHVEQRVRDGWQVLKRDELEAVIARPEAVGGIHVLLTLVVGIVPENMTLPGNTTAWQMLEQPRCNLN